MQSPAKDQESARQKLLRTEQALDAYVHGGEFNYETCKRLLEAVHSARGEVLELLSALWPERDQATSDRVECYRDF